MVFQLSLKTWLAVSVLQLLTQTSLAVGLATVTPCPDCGSSIAPPPITVTTQYQTVATCKPSTTTVFSTYTKSHTTRTTSKVKTTPSCSPYAWVSTTIPTYHDWTKTSTIVTTTNQPVTFNSLHYTEAHTTTLTLPGPHFGGNHSFHNGTHHNDTHLRTTIEVSYTTIDIKNYCDYNSLGPIAIPGYGGSGLCTDCGPDASSALTQRLTVISCSDLHCTTFNETRIASPQTSILSSKPYTVTTTNTYCPTATPVSAIPGYTATAPTGTASPTSLQSTPSQSSDSHSSSPSGPDQSGTASPQSTPGQSSNSPSSPTEHPSNSAGPSSGPSVSSYGQQSGSVPSPGSSSHPQQSSGANSPGTYPGQTGSTLSATTTATHPSSYPTQTTPPTPTGTYSEPEPTESDEPTSSGSPDHYPDPSGDLGYDEPAPTAYHPRRRDSPKVFKRQGLEKPRGRVMKRSGLLYWGT